MFPPGCGGEEEKDEGEEEGKRRRGAGKNEGKGFGRVKLDLAERIQGVTF